MSRSRSESESTTVSPRISSVSDSTVESFVDPSWFLSGDGDLDNHIDKEELEFWGEHLVRWQSCCAKQNAEKSKEDFKLIDLVQKRILKNGIPNILRGELWPTLISDSHTQIEDLENKYRLLVKRASKWQTEIAMDISRTFPAHPKFVENEKGQMELFRVLKAYSNYDPELGYCQGTNFIAATLLVQMPEERAFAVFVCLMYNGNLRNIYINDFEGLSRILFFIDQLLNDGSSKLRKHLINNNIESPMYAHQWILSWFSSRFPLPLANRVFDILTLSKSNCETALIRLSVTMLLYNRADLFDCEIDDFIDYFRATLPSKFSHKIGVEESGAFYPEVEKFIKTFQKYNLRSFRLAIMEAEWKNRKRNLRNPNNQEVVIASLRVDNCDLMAENEILRKENQKFKMQIDEMNHQWTEIALNKNPSKPP